LANRLNFSFFGGSNFATASGDRVASFFVYPLTGPDVKHERGEAATSCQLPVSVVSCQRGKEMWPSS
jgi:hypothetical protein